MLYKASCFEKKDQKKESFLFNRFVYMKKIIRK